MALKAKLRSRYSKRFGNVEDGSHFTSKRINCSSSDSEPDALDSRNKVRDGFSVKGLMKKSECCIIDNDHVYTSARPGDTSNNSIKRRKISEESIERLPKERCFSKNAVMARLNRERKKKYISSLETENESLRKENNEINRKLEEQKKRISVLNREVLYLKGLLANSKELKQILMNLKDVTGLPITSSFISASKAGDPNDFLEKSSASEQKQGIVEYHPRIRTVNSGRNFPILDKDINLGSCSDNSFNKADLESCPFQFEIDSYGMSPQNFNENDDFFSLSNNMDLGLEEYFNMDNISNKSEPEAGICLHVNQKRISVEICSICNDKAASLGFLCPQRIKKLYKGVSQNNGGAFDLKQVIFPSLCSCLKEIHKGTGGGTLMRSDFCPLCTFFNMLQSAQCQR